jgi:RNA polymerase sigma-70 factor, ECF subfamily
LSQVGSAEIAQWYPRLYRTALRLTRSADDAADLTQQTFYQALRGWDRFDGKVRPTTWLHAILLNCVRDWARRRAARPVEPLDEWSVPAAERSPGTPLEAVERSEEGARLRAAIDALPAPIRQAFAATVLDGYTYQEASELLSSPIGTIASRVYEARRRLREAMPDAISEA